MHLELNKMEWNRAKTRNIIPKIWCDQFHTYVIFSSVIPRHRSGVISTIRMSKLLTLVNEIWAWDVFIWYLYRIFSKCMVSSTHRCSGVIPPGNFCRLIGENETRKKGKNGNVEENEEKRKREGGKLKM